MSKRTTKSAAALTTKALESFDYAALERDFPQIVNGRPNVERLRALSRLCEKAKIEALTGVRQLPRNVNLDHLARFIEAEAKRVYGADPKHILDARTDAEKADDLFDRIIEQPTSAFEAPDDEIQAALDTLDQWCSVKEQAMDDVERGCDDYLRRELARAQEDAESNEKVKGGYRGLGKGAAERAARIRSLLKRIRTLRRRAREPMAWGPNNPDVRPEAIRAAHVGRYMIYTRRSDMASSADPPESQVFRFGPHHCKILCDICEAENGWYLGCPTNRKGNPDPRKEATIIPGMVDYVGVWIICPPGHGKTAICQGWTSLRISENPDRQGTYLHNSNPVAATVLRYIGAAFDDQYAAGRRNRVLFPGIVADTITEDGRLRLRSDERKKTETLLARGVFADRQGIDNDFQVYDDVVPQEDYEEETTRQKRIAKINGTWRGRLRGENHFTLAACTLWHHEDYNARTIALARRGRIKIRVSKQSVGGPNTTPKFYHLWDVLPPRELRSRYMQMDDPRLWAASYMADPQPDEFRIVRKLRFYDPNRSEHRRFIEAEPRYFLSLDPSYSNREGADKTGLVYGALGLVHWDGVDEDDGSPVRCSEMRLRIIEAREFNANAADAAEAVKSFALMHPVDTVMVESHSGGENSAMWIERECGIEVQKYRPGNLSKEKRLRRAAKMLEDHVGRVSVSRAVVEFPGEPSDEGEAMVPMPSVRGLCQQILDFGMTSQDHMLDACTQLCNELAPELQPGAGEASERIARMEGRKTDPRIKAWLNRVRQSQRDPGLEAEWNLLS